MTMHMLSDFRSVLLLILAWFLIGLLLGRLWGRRPAAPAPAPAAGNNKRKPGVVELYVGNLSYDLSEKELSKLFERFGRVESARIITKRSDGQSRGYGFVQMPERGEAMAAIDGLNGKEINGRALIVNEAKTRGKSRR